MICYESLWIFMFFHDYHHILSFPSFCIILNTYECLYELWNVFLCPWNDILSVETYLIPIEYITLTLFLCFHVLLTSFHGSQYTFIFLYNTNDQYVHFTRACVLFKILTIINDLIYVSRAVKPLFLCLDIPLIFKFIMNNMFEYIIYNASQNTCFMLSY